MSLDVKAESVAASCLGHCHCRGRYRICDELWIQTRQASSLHKTLDDIKALIAQIYRWIVRHGAEHISVVLSLVARNNRTMELSYLVVPNLCCELVLLAILLMPPVRFPNAGMLFRLSNTWGYSIGSPYLWVVEILQPLCAVYVYRYSRPTAVSSESWTAKTLSASSSTRPVWSSLKVREPVYTGLWGNTVMLNDVTIVSHDRRTGMVRFNMLSSLSQFNFSRALMLNADVFGLSADHMHDDACSLFVVAGPWPDSINLNTETLPDGLRPTRLQYRTEHHPWIDLLPVAQLRNNILERSVDSYDEEGLCRAFTGRGHGQGPGVIVWREPWDPSGWEVTAEFARSWGWVISGCFDLFRSTNMWRSQRGERPLFRSQ